MNVPPRSICVLVWTEPIFITKILDKNGVVLEEFTPKTQEAMSRETADLMIRLLQGVADGGYNPEIKKKRGTGKASGNLQ